MSAKTWRAVAASAPISSSTARVLRALGRTCSPSRREADWRSPAATRRLISATPWWKAMWSWRTLAMSSTRRGFLVWNAAWNRPKPQTAASVPPSKERPLRSSSAASVASL